jgi:hypothetical protein
VTKGSDSLCGAKTAGFNIKLQNPAPHGEKLPIGQRIGRSGMHYYDYFPPLFTSCISWYCLLLMQNESRCYQAGARSCLSLTVIKSCDWT